MLRVVSQFFAKLFVGGSFINLSSFLPLFNKNKLLMAYLSALLYKAAFGNILLFTL
jgi:hypothetical protein